jgi:hypothetical protein
MENQVTKPKFPTEMVDLPSKGLLYPEGSPLRSGQIEMKYMTAREEDILTNQNYIQQGTVLDKLIESLIVSKIDIKELLVGDKNAILIASRILGYGKDYTFKYRGETYTVDLSLIDPKPFDENLFARGINRFSFIMPSTGAVVEFKILTHADEKKIAQEVQGIKKLNPEASPESSTRLKHMILSVDGSSEQKDIRNYVDNYLLARDAREFREHVTSFQPDVDLTFFPERAESRVNIPIGLNFFWPDA